MGLFTKTEYTHVKRNNDIKLEKETEEERKKKKKQEAWERKQSEKAYATLHAKEVRAERKKKTVEGLKKTSRRMERSTEAVTTGAGRVASGFQKRVIEGKTSVTVRGGTIYPKKKKLKPKYYAKGKTTGRKTKKTYQKKKQKASYEQEPTGMPGFDPFGAPPSGREPPSMFGLNDEPPKRKTKKGKKPPMFFDPFG